MSDHRIPSGVLLAALMTLLPVAAHGHAFPVTLSPPVGHTLSASPPAVEITFDANLEPLFDQITVKNLDGTAVQAGPATLATDNPRVLTATLPTLLSGTYEVDWSVVATDGHRTSGRYVFMMK